MISIAIDGPAGAGKSTVAKAVSKKLSYIYVDTGALYRVIGLYVVRNELTDEESVKKKLNEIKLSLGFINGEQKVFLFDEDVSDKIRTPEISMSASKVSTFLSVRKFLLNLQRNLAKKNNIIMDGRDIGTVILPDAQVKIFLTASLEERSKRRYRELIEKNCNVTYEEVLNDIIKRDYNDSNRPVAPLKPATDAVILDTSNYTFKESVDLVLNLIKDKLGKLDNHERK